RPSAQGQAITRTAIAAWMAYETFGSGPQIIQPTKVKAPSTRTSGTNRAETESAMRCIGALEPCASSTNRTIWASVVSRPTFVASQTQLPGRLIVGADNGCPGSL